MNQPYKPTTPPRWATTLLEWLCPDDLHEEIGGDLQESFEERVEEAGERQARKEYVLAVLGYMRPFAFKQNTKHPPKPLYMDMLLNYAIIAFRNIRRQKAFSFINIAGLSLGLACSIVILLWVQNEVSYDRFHKQADSMYRLTMEVSDLKTAVTSAPIAPAIQAQIPGIEKAVRLIATHNLLEADNRKFEEVNGFFADSSFFSLFNFPFLYGNPSTSLSRPEAIVITTQLAEKYFGKENALGKTIRLDNKEYFTVTGVVQMPPNTHLQFNYLLPMHYYARTKEGFDRWGNLEYYTYVQLKEGIQNHSPAFEKITTQINRIFAENEEGYEVNIGLQPITSIYLHSALIGDVPWLGNIQYVRIFSVVAIFILLVACINFMNLATARSARRAKEVGLRKVIGARRTQLIGQFLGESMLISFLSFLCALLIVYLVLPVFNEFTGKSLSLNIAQPQVIGWLLLIALLTGLLAGSYPALFLSAFRPVEVLKGKIQLKGKSYVFRNSLVVMQFVVSIILMVGTGVVYSQLQYIKTKNLGFDKENLLYVSMNGDLWRNYQALRTELASHPLTSHFTAVSALPVNADGGGDVDFAGRNPDEKIFFTEIQVDENFIKTFGLQLISGRGFYQNYPADTTGYIVNEAALHVMGMNADSAIGKYFSSGPEGKIIGVVKDFHFKPLRQWIEPLVLSLNTRGGAVVVRTQPGHTEATIRVLEQICRKLNPSFPFAYNFMEEDLDKLYQSEQRMSRIANTFAILSVLISCLGLYGLAAFTAEQRTKEIGIRKVLGASLPMIVTLLSKDFLKPVLVANLIAWPLAWWAMHHWLQDFAYQIDISLWVFMIAGGIALLIALFTVGYQAVKVATINPVNSLRNE